MAEDQLSSFADIPAMQAELDRIEGMVLEFVGIIKKAHQDIKGIEFKIQDPASVREAITNSRQAEKAVSDLTIAVSEYNKLNTQRVITEAKIAAASSEEARALAATKAELNEISLALKKEAQAQNESTKARQAAAQAAKEKNQADKEYQALWKQLLKDREQEEKMMARLSNAYLVLTDQVNDTEAQYKRLAAAYGINHPLALQAQKDLAELRTRFDAINKNAGDFRRNVGNYASGFNGLNVAVGQIARELPNAALSAQAFISSLSNQFGQLKDAIDLIIAKNKALRAEGKATESVLKQLGASILSVNTALAIGVTVFVAYGKEIGDLFSEILNGKKAISDFELAFTNLNKINQAAADTFAKQSVQLELLQKRFFDAGATVNDKKQVIEELNKAFGDTVGKIDSINEAEKFFVDRGPAFRESLLLRAQIEGAYGSIVENTAKLLKEQAKGIDEQLTGAQRLGKSILTAVGGGGAAVANSIDQSAKNISKLKSETDRANNFLSDFVTKNSEKLDALAEKFNFNLTKDPKAKGGKDTTSAELAGEDRLLKAREKLANDKIQIELEKNKAIFEDDEQSLNDRLNALHKYQALQLKQAETAEGSLVAQLQAQLSTIEKIEAKSVDSRSQGEKRLLLSKEAILLELEDAEAVYYDNLGKIANEGKKKETAIIAAESKKQVDIILSNLNNISENENSKRQQDLQLLQDQLSKGLISTADYNIQREAINKKYNQAILDNTLDYLKESLSAQGLEPAEIAKIQEAITNITNKGIEERAKARENDIKKQQDARKKIVELEKQLAYELFNLITGLIDARYQREINQVQQAASAREDQYQKERSAIESANISDEQKKQQTAVLDAKIADDKQRTEKKLAELNRKRAIAQKIENIGNIAAATALAEVQALSYLANPLTAPAYPAIAALIAAIGAAQTAIVLEQPLPAYQFGTDNAKEGPGIWGEVGTEMKVGRDGSIEFSPSKPTVGYFKAGDKVIPNDELKRGAALPYLEQAGLDDTNIIRALGEGFDDLNRTIKKQRPIVNIHSDERFTRIYNNQKN